MNGFRSLNKLSKYTALGLVAWAGGMYTEKYRSGAGTRNFENCELPIFNRFVVKAAKNFGGGDHYSKQSSVVPFEESSVIHVEIEETCKVTDKASRVGEIMRYGFPGMNNIIAYDDFVVSYDKRNRVPYWVFEHLTRDNTKWNEKVSRAGVEFFEDSSVHQYFRSTNDDYKGSGFDRGHLAAAGNHRKCQDHMNQTFVLSNISPQVGKGFNRDSWNRLEQYVRQLTKFYKSVYVCSGPLYLPKREADGKLYVKYQVIGKNNVAVPTHFFKVVLGESDNGSLEMEAYVMPNAPIDDNVPLDSFLVPLDAVEKGAGLLFFDKVDKKKLKYMPPKSLKGPQDRQRG